MCLCLLRRWANLASVNFILEITAPEARLPWPHPSDSLDLTPQSEAVAGLSPLNWKDILSCWKWDKGHPLVPDSSLPPAPLFFKLIN